MGLIYSFDRTAGGALVFDFIAGAAFAVSAAGLASTAAFGNPTFTFSAGFSVVAAGLPSSAAFGVPTVNFSNGAFSVQPAGLASTLAFGSPTFRFTDGSYTPAASHPRRLVVTVDPRVQCTTLPGSGGALAQPYPLSPDSKLDIECDWRPWLAAEDGDILASYAIAWAGPELGVLSDQAEASAVIRTWLDLPPDAVEQTRSAVVFTITTAAGRVDSRKYELLVKQL